MCALEIKRELRTEGRRAAAQEGGHQMSMGYQSPPMELRTPGLGSRAKGQAWNDIGAQGSRIQALNPS